MYQYRITVDGAPSPITNAYPGQRWAAIADTCEERGLPATFERRLVTDPDILDLVSDTAGYIKLGNRVACPWETIAVL